MDASKTHGSSGRASNTVRWILVTLLLMLMMGQSCATTCPAGSSKSQMEGLMTINAPYNSTLMNLYPLFASSVVDSSGNIYLGDLNMKVLKLNSEGEIQFLTPPFDRGIGVAINPRMYLMNNEQEILLVGSGGGEHLMTIFNTTDGALKRSFKIEGTEGAGFLESSSVSPSGSTFYVNFGHNLIMQTWRFQYSEGVNFEWADTNVSYYLVNNNAVAAIDDDVSVMLLQNETTDHFLVFASINFTSQSLVWEKTADWFEVQSGEILYELLYSESRGELIFAYLYQTIIYTMTTNATNGAFISAQQYSDLNIVQQLFSFATLYNDDTLLMYGSTYTVDSQLMVHKLGSSTISAYRTLKDGAGVLEIFYLSVIPGTSRVVFGGSEMNSDTMSPTIYFGDLDSLFMVDDVLIDTRNMTGSNGTFYSNYGDMDPGLSLTFANRTVVDQNDTLLTHVDTYTVSTPTNYGNIHWYEETKSLDGGVSGSFTSETACFENFTTNSTFPDLTKISATYANGSDLDAWLSFDNTTQTFSTTSGVVGDYEIEMVAKDEDERLEFITTISLTVTSPIPCVVSDCSICSVADDTVCETCSSGFEVTTGDQWKRICDDTNCDECPTAADICGTCDSGFEADGSNGCKRICDDANCDTCTASADVCDSWDSGFELLANDTCKRICDDANCDVCSTAADVCDTCDSGFESDGSDGCKRTCDDSGCDICSVDAAVCEDWLAGFDLLANDTCKRIWDDANCDTCSSAADVCDTCDSGFEPDGSNGCKRICDDANCDICSASAAVCEDCDSGFNLLANDTCKRICDDSGCDTCTANAAVCEDCFAGFDLLANDTCKRICDDSNCDTCSSAADVCDICDSGWEPDGSDGCKRSCDDANCDICSANAAVCEDCDPGFDLLANDTCKRQCDDPNCDTCSGAADVCEICNSEWELDGNNGCKRICDDENCNLCAAAADQCTECASGYKLDDAAACQEEASEDEGCMGSDSKDGCTVTIVIVVVVAVLVFAGVVVVIVIVVFKVFFAGSSVASGVVGVNVIANTATNGPVLPSQPPVPSENGMPKKTEMPPFRDPMQIV